MSCLLLVAAIVGGFAVGLAIKFVFGAAGIDENLSSAMGTGAWFVTIVLVTSYGDLWLQKRRPKRNSELKMDAVEFRMAFVFAIIGGTTSALANATCFTLAVSMAMSAALGWFVGRDLWYRRQRIADEFTVLNHKRLSNPP